MVFNGDLDPPCPSLKGRELYSPFKGEKEGVFNGGNYRFATIPSFHLLFVGGSTSLSA